MKCIAVTPTQARLDGGGIRTFADGDIWEFKKCPPNFEPMEGKNAKEIDFDNAGEAELMEAEYELQDLKDFIEEKYGKKAGSRGKEKTVAFLLDCRYREINGDPNKVI